MSLSKQLLLLVSLLFLMIFCVNFWVGVNNVRDYLQEESRVHAQDTATSLGLSLSPHLAENENDPIIQTMIQAIFDMGYYQDITLVNVDNKVLVHLTNPRVFEEIPAWFVNWLPLQPARAESEISAGWNIAGTIQVTTHPGYAYLKLYEQARSAFYYSLAALIVTVLLLFAVLRLILKPLAKIDALAHTIANGEFAQIEKLPWTSEVRNVARSMNFMSKKIERVIHNLNAKLEALNQRMLLDDLTHLHKRGTFETDMKELFLARGQGAVFLVRVDSLAEIAKAQGNTTADRLLIDVAEILKACTTSPDWGEARVYRFYGAEFVALVQNIDVAVAETIGRAMQQAFGEIGMRYDVADLAHIGVTPINPFGTIDGTLAAAHEAYEQAKLIGANSYAVRVDPHQGRNLIEWHALVDGIIRDNTYQVIFTGPVAALDNDHILMEEAFTKVADEHDTPIPIGVFIAIAEKFDRIVELDKGVTHQVIQYIHAQGIRHAIAINLSLATLRSAEFRLWLMEQLKTHQAIAGQLVFSVTAYTAAKDLELFKDFIAFVHNLGAKIILKRYEPQFIPIDTVKALKPDYIRLARDLTQGISSDFRKKMLVETMKEVGDLLDIAILAENVQTQSDFDIVKQIGLPGASR